MVGCTPDFHSATHMTAAMTTAAAERPTGAKRSARSAPNMATAMASATGSTRAL